MASQSKKNNNITFEESYQEYKNGNSILLKNWVKNTKKVGVYEWYYLMELIVEQKVMNLPLGNFYLNGTLDVFHEALSKTSKKDGKISFDKRLSAEFLSENSEYFTKFLDLYEEKTNHIVPWGSLLLSWRTGSALNFWEDFHNKIVEELEKVKDEDLLSYINNVNYVFSKDKTQHKKIQSYLEFDSEYPNNVLIEAITYSYNFDKYIFPRYSLSNLGRTEEVIEKLKLINVRINSALLEKELNSNLNDKKEKKFKL